MPRLDRPRRAGESRPVGVRPRRAPDPRGKPWVVRKPAADLDARNNPLPKEIRLLLDHLEALARDRCYCWVRNVELAARYGCKRRNIQKQLRAAEEVWGVILRVP